MAENRTPSRATRRGFLGGAIAAGVAVAARAGASPTILETRGARMIELPSLPYGESDLAPHISAETISFHYGKHHKAYVDNTNKMIDGTDLAGASLEDIVKAAAGKPDKKGLFNNSAQVWNHTFYWKSLSPKGGGQPTGKLLDRIKSDFGDFAKFKDDLAKAAATQFGSGWAWLVLEGGKLKIEQTAERRDPADRGQQEAAPHHRRVGARLLRGLPEQASGLRGRGPRQARQLGVRRPEPGLAPAPSRRPVRAGVAKDLESPVESRAGSRTRTRSSIASTRPWRRGPGTGRGRMRGPDGDPVERLPARHQRPFGSHQEAAGAKGPGTPARGRPLGIEDVLIGATAIVGSLTVATRNLRHFRRLPGLAVESWWPEANQA